MCKRIEHLLEYNDIYHDGYGNVGGHVEFINPRNIHTLVAVWDDGSIERICQYDSLGGKKLRNKELRQISWTNSNRSTNAEVLLTLMKLKDSGKYESFEILMN